MKVAITHGYERVNVDGTEISRHRLHDEAIESATNEALKVPGSTVVIKTDDVRVVATEATPAPTPTPVPTPAPTPTPTPTPVPNAVRVNYVDPIDGAAKFYDVAYSRVLYVSPDGTGDGSALNPLSPGAVIANATRGTVFVFRGGQYRGNYGGNWGNRNFALGPAQSGIALIGEPGAELISPDSTQHGNIILYNGAGTADDVTIARFKAQGGGECVFGGGYTENESGAKRALIIGNIFSARYPGNSMTGLVSMQGDGCKVIGNIFENTGWGAFYNNNHALYVQSGADDVLVEANLFRNLQLGHVIQVHQDGTGQQYDHITIRRNKITAANPMHCRGITVSNVADTSSVLIEENLLDNVGQQFAGVSVYGGIVALRNNTLRNVMGGDVGKIWLSSQYNHNPILYIQGNIIEGGSGPDYGVDGVPLSNIRDL